MQQIRVNQKAEARRDSKMRKQKQEERRREEQMNKRFNALQASIKKLLGANKSNKIEVGGFSDGDKGDDVAADDKSFGVRDFSDYDGSESNHSAVSADLALKEVILATSAGFTDEVEGFALEQDDVKKGYDKVVRDWNMQDKHNGFNVSHGSGLWAIKH